MMHHIYIVHHFHEIHEGNIQHATVNKNIRVPVAVVAVESLLNNPSGAVKRIKRYYTRSIHGRILITVCFLHSAKLPDMFGGALVDWTIAPALLRENADLILFLVILTYSLLALNWIVTTDWESKIHWGSLAICAIGVFYLHYSDVVLLHEYENVFVTVWLVLLWYHWSTWKNNYSHVQQELQNRNPAASLRPFQGSIFRILICMPTTKNASNQWNAPPFKNAIHVFLCFGYISLLTLHVIPFVTPLRCLADPSPTCCRYNYAMQGFDSQEVNQNFCSGRVRVGTFQ